MDDKHYISLLTGTGPGLLPHEPIALIISGNPEGLNKFASSCSVEVDATLSNPQFGKHPPHCLLRVPV
jgi:hypothetical protein